MLTEKQKTDIKKCFPNMDADHVEKAIEINGLYRRTLGRQERLLNGDPYKVCCGNCIHMLIRDHGFGDGSCFIESLWHVIEYGDNNCSSGYNDMFQCCSWWRPNERTKEQFNNKLKVEQSTRDAVIQVGVK